MYVYQVTSHLTKSHMQLVVNVLGSIVLREENLGYYMIQKQRKIYQIL